MSKRGKNVWTKELSWREHIVRDRKKNRWKTNSWINLVLKKGNKKLYN